MLQCWAAKTAATAERIAIVGTHGNLINYKYIYTHHSHVQLLPEATKTSPFPPPPDNTFPSSAPVEIELEKKDLDLSFLNTSTMDTTAPRQFPSSDLLLLDKLGEGEYGPIYR